jgi:hypothetical protein
MIVSANVGEGELNGKLFGGGSPRSGASATGGGGVCVPIWMSGMMIGRTLQMYSAMLVQCLAELFPKFSDLRLGDLLDSGL